MSLISTPEYALQNAEIIFVIPQLNAGTIVRRIAVMECVLSATYLMTQLDIAEEVIRLKEAVVKHQVQAEKHTAQDAKPMKACLPPIIK